MADIGYIVLVLALCASVYAIVALIVGEWKHRSQLVDSGRNAILVVCGLIGVASIALLHALLTHDFSLEFVWAYSSKDMPVIYTISAFWAGNVGSLLFWTLVLAVFVVIVVIQNWRKRGELVSYASAIIMVSEFFFLLMLVFVVNPFEELPATPADGRGLNPQLMNPGMIIHPPTLLIGFAAFTIPFAFALAALISGRLGDQWLKDTRKWALIAWLTLGVGNIIGMWWAYVELGWGGYWAWDPVENAGLMPWLLGTAFLHTVMMQRKRGMFKILSMVLIQATFIMCIFGTYLTRSNILSSVHTFGDTGLDPYFLTLLSIIIIGSIGLLIYRWKKLESGSKITSILSREAAFLATGVLFIVATALVFLGTMWPKITDLFGDQKYWDTSQFDWYVGSVFVLLIFLMGICAVVGWKRASVNNLRDKLLIPLIGALLLCVILAITGIREWFALVFFPLFAFGAFTIFLEWYRGVKARRRTKKENPPLAFLKLITSNRARYGGMIVHLGILLLAMGIIGSSFYDAEERSPLQQGDEMHIRGYTLTYEGYTFDDTGGNYTYAAEVSVQRDGHFVTTLEPKRVLDPDYESMAYVHEVAVRTDWITGEDLYVSLDELEDNGTVAVITAQTYPLINWMWIGGGVLLLGGVISFWPDRQKKKAGQEGRP